MARRTEVHRLAMAHPGDTSSIEALVAAGALDLATVVAVLGKTEGNGCVNDFTRGYATQSLALMFARLAPGVDVDGVSLIMSGGTEGGLSPHWLVIAVVEDAPAGCGGTSRDASGDVASGDAASGAGASAAGESEGGASGGGADGSGMSLAAASAMTPPLDPTAIGRRAQAEAVREATLAAMARAAIAAPQDVHFVQVKCPLLTSERVAAAGAERVATTDLLASMGLSRGASALGVALALGEVADAAVTDAAIGSDLALWSSRASASAGIELTRCEVTVLGMSAAFTGPLAIASTVLRDAIDAASAAALLRRLWPDAVVPMEAPGAVRAVLCKAEASKSGTIRGRRHTMLDDSDISSTRHARGFVGGMLAGLLGETALFVSGGAEHQGPDGGGPCAIIAERA